MTVQHGLEDITLYIYIAFSSSKHKSLDWLEGISLLYPDNRCLIVGIIPSYAQQTQFCQCAQITIAGDAPGGSLKRGFV